MSEESGCDFQQTVAKSLKSGFVNEEISRHVKACADCRETAKVMQFFQANLVKESPPKNLPVAGLVWWKFKLREKQRRAERVAQPMLIAQLTAVLIITGTFIWVRQSNSPQILSVQAAFSRAFDSLEVIAFPLITGAACIAFVSAILIFALRRFMPDK
jgi:hypothetical protein